MWTKEDLSEKRCSWEEYMGQFVTRETIKFVRAWIGEKEIKSSTDRSFNDIPLWKWDVLAGRVPHNRELWKQVEGWYSQSSWVCLAKAAAREIRDNSEGRR